MQPLNILYQDEHLVAVHKPSGLLVHRSALARGETEFLLQRLRDQLGKRVYPVHRLDRPTSGTLWYRDTELTALDEADLTRFRRSSIGFIFQFYNLIPSLTAEENVRLVTDIAENPMSAKEALELVGLGDRRHHFPAQLSGGEQQRVAVARAVAKRPGVLLCDEPTGALDSATGVRVLETLAEANRELGTTLILITHNAGIAAMADRVFNFLDGQIASIETNENRISASEMTW